MKQNKEMFLAMRDIFYGGEFSNWLGKQKTIPFAALREYLEAMEYFEQETGYEITKLIFDKVNEE